MKLRCILGKCLAVASVLLFTSALAVGTANAQQPTRGRLIAPAVNPPSDLVQVDPTQVPSNASWFSLANPNSVPMPCFGLIHSLHPDWTVYYSPSFGTGLNTVWMDDSSIYSMQADSMQLDTPLTPGPDDSESSGYPPGTLYLQILSVSNNVWVAIYGLTNGNTGEILARTSLTDGDWLSEGSLVSTNDDLNIVMLTVGDRTNSLFLTCRSPASDNSLPLSWQLDNFGLTGVPPDGDFDQDGLNNLQEYLNGTDPNTCVFSATFDSLRTSAAAVNATLAIAKGVPSQMAVLLDNTNLDAASWTNYTSTISIPFAVSEGAHQVWIGVKGRSSASVPMFLGYQIARDLTAPTVIVSSPADGHLTQPVLELSGYATEPVSLSWRVDPAGVTGQGYTVGRFFDTNLLDFTTNWFDCLNLPLTSGANTVTLYATDLAGNVGTSTSTFYFDYPTNPPALALYWPQDGALVSADAFTVRGWISDPTASVVAQIVDPLGNTNSVQAVVGRNGLVWAESVPLPDGTNTVSLIATDIATNSTVTNFTIVKSEVNLTITPLDTSVLNQPRVTVMGSIDSTGYTVWVNGMAATNVWDNGDGTWGWEAEGVPLPAGGTAVVQAQAIFNTDNGGNGTGGLGGTSSSYANPGNPASCCPTPVAEDQQDKPAEVVEIHYDLSFDYKNLQPRGTNLLHDATHQDTSWDLGQPGHNSWSRCYGEDPNDYFEWNDLYWDADGNGTALGVTVGSGCGIKTNGEPFQATAPTHWPGLFCSISAQRPLAWADGTESVTRNGKTRYELHTGGKAGSSRQNLFVGTITLGGVGNAFYPEIDPDAGTNNIVAPTDVVLTDLGRLGSDWAVYQVLQDDMTNDVTPVVQGNPYFTNGTPDVSKHKLYIDANGTNLETNTPEFCVGQNVSLSASWDPPLPLGTQTQLGWIMSPDYVNRILPGNGDASAQYIIDDSLLTNNPTSLWWYSDGSKHVWCQTTNTFPNGQVLQFTQRGDVTVYTPFIANFEDGPAAYCSDPNTSSYLELGDGNGHGDMQFTITILSKYSGRGDFTQLINRSAQNALTTDTTYDSYYLDNFRFYLARADNPEYPAPIHANIFTDFDMSDSPCFPLAWVVGNPNTSVVDLFQDYIIFRPNAGNPSSNIYVCIAKQTWSWSASTTHSLLNGWSIPSPSIVRPEWPEPSHDFPAWLHTYHNP